MNTLLDFFYKDKKHDVKLGLETMQRMMELLGHPERAFRVVHVAGTNGKGSVVASISSILRCAGFSVGTYTSPHLERFNERIVADGAEIADIEIDALTSEIHALAEANSIDLTFFEFATVIAFLYFARKKIEIAVVEVGLGGRLDATNIVTPDVAVITHIGLEHMDLLGNTLASIAAEKAGIIKENSVVVTAETKPEIITIFRDICIKKHAQLVNVWDTLSVEHIVEHSHGQEFVLDDKTYFIPLLGKHQVDNACTAIMTIEFLHRFPVDINHIIEGLAQAVWPGRLEVISRKPFVMLDGAHNPDGAAALCDYVKKMPMRKVLVLGISNDKNADEMVRLLAPLFETIIVTASGPKPLDADVLGAIVRCYHGDVRIVSDLVEALRMGTEIVGDGLLLVAGSLYLVGNARGILR